MLGGMRRDRDGRYGNFHGLSGRKQEANDRASCA